MVAARRTHSLLLTVLLALSLAGAALADSMEDMTVARSRMNASAEKLRRANVRMTDEQKARKRELLNEAASLHDKSKALSPGNDTGAAELVGKMDTTRDDIDEFVGMLEQPAEAQAATGDFSSGGDTTTTVDTSGTAAEPMPEEPPRPLSSGATIAQYRDMVRDVENVRARLVPSEYAHARDLIVEGDAIAAAIEANPHEDHVARAEHAAELAGVTQELQDLHVLALSDRRLGIPFVDAKTTPTGWTNVGLEQGPFHVLRARFLKPGSSYITIRNASDTARPFAISVDFTDVSGQPTGNAAFVSQADASLRAGEVREVLLGIAPSVERFWDRTSDFTVSVR